MASQPDHLKVLTEYPQELQPQALEFLGSGGGFSGSVFWRILTAGGPMCLRRWPREHPSEAQLQMIHAVLRHAAGVGLHFLPVPCTCRSGTGHVRRAGHLWELSPWMPGTADYHQKPTRSRLSAALAALAQFHVAAGSSPADVSTRGPSPGIADRQIRLRRWLSEGMSSLTDAPRPSRWPEFDSRMHRILSLIWPKLGDVLLLLDRRADREVPLQPCIRDVWHDHVLFTGDRVTGMVDFGALGWDNVTIDVARLLGSMARNDSLQWQVGLEAYQAVRPLSPEESQLVKAFDLSGAMMAGLNWADWVYRQQRVFDNREGVLHRLDEILLRIEGVDGGSQGAGV